MGIVFILFLMLVFLSGKNILKVLALLAFGWKSILYYIGLALSFWLSARLDLPARLGFGELDAFGKACLVCFTIYALAQPLVWRVRKFRREEYRRAR